MSSTNNNEINTPYRLFVYKEQLKKDQRKERSKKVLCQAKIYLTQGLVANCMQNIQSRAEHFESLSRSIEYSRKLQKKIIRQKKPVESTYL